MGCVGGLTRVRRGDATIRALAARFALPVEHDTDRDRREDDYRDQDRHDRGRATTAGFSLVGHRGPGSATGDFLRSADAVVAPAAVAGRLGAFAAAAVTATAVGRGAAGVLQLFLSGAFFRFFFGRSLIAAGADFG